jgi:hypothetical protein
VEGEGGASDATDARFMKQKDEVRRALSAKNL